MRIVMRVIFTDEDMIVLFTDGDSEYIYIYIDDDDDSSDENDIDR
jgi:hypothetical protein